MGENVQQLLSDGLGMLAFIGGGGEEPLQQGITVLPCIISSNNI